MNPDGPLGRDRTVIWRGRAAEDAYQPGGLFVASHHTAGNRRNRSVSAGGALCRGDVCQSEQGRRSECQMDHFGFHLAALAKLDRVVRVIRTQKIVYANSAQSSGGLVICHQKSPDCLAHLISCNYEDKQAPTSSPEATCDGGNRPVTPGSIS